MNLYHQDLIDHYHHPRHKGVLKEPTFTSEMHNPSCGDSVSWQGIYDIEQEKITAIAFTGKGCVISQAVASMLASKALSKSRAIVLEWNKQMILSMIGMDLGPTRLKCALLPLESLQKGVGPSNA